jgi:hypothetical protein
MGGELASPSGDMSDPSDVTLICGMAELYTDFGYNLEFPDNE